MPALSYKERFVPYVQDGTKSQTIRAFRKRPFVAGDVLMHYTGMRTKWCKKIRENTMCTDVQTIFILQSGTVLLGPWLTKKRAERWLESLDVCDNPDGKNLPIYSEVTLKILSPAQCEELAWCDGFKLNDAPFGTVGCFASFLAFWNDTHALPFTGQLIKW